MHGKHTDQLPSKVIKMLQGMKKHEDKEYGKTLKHEATQNKNHTATTALERSVA